MRPVLFLATLLFVPAVSATETTPWPPAHKAAAIAGCRASITDHAERDYLRRSQLTELPPDFRKKAAPAMEPFLAVCDCVYEHFEKVWTFEYYAAHQDEAMSKLKELMAGACAMKAVDPNTTPSVGLARPAQHGR